MNCIHPHCRKPVVQKFGRWAHVRENGHFEERCGDPGTCALPEMPGEGTSEGLAFELAETRAMLTESKRANAGLLRSCLRKDMALAYLLQLPCDRDDCGFEAAFTREVATLNLGAEQTGRLMALFMCAVDERRKSKIEANQ